MARLSYFIVEGPHDSAVIGKLLRQPPLSLTPVPLMKDVDTFWAPLIPRTYPPKNPATHDEEFKRVQVPEFYQNQTLSVAVQWAEGFDKIATVLNDDLDVLNGMPAAIGVLVDADTKQVQAVFEDVRDQIQAKLVALNFANAGVVTQGNPSTGIYVLPDNANPGTLEDLLLDCAVVAYPQLHPIAVGVSTAVANGLAGNAAWLSKSDSKDFRKNAGPKKTQMGVMGSVLKPSRAIANTIRDHSWISPATMALPRVKQLAEFVAALVRQP